jgi:hypothetical protein
VTVSAALKDMAQVAWAKQIKGQTLRRNSLLVPMAIFFDQIRKQQPVLDMEALRAASIEKIFDHLDRISERGRGKSTREALEHIANRFFYTLLQENYGGKIHRMISDEKDLKAAYLFYLRSNITKKEEL